jgi:DNA-binding transcriptional MerR regulator
MEDDKFIKELKENAVRNKLPTAGDLGPGYSSPFEGKNIENKPISNEIPKKQEIDQPIKEDRKEDLFKKVKELYQEGDSVEEIYQALSELGYSYEEIEEAILKVTRGENQGEEKKREAVAPGRIEEIADIENRLEEPIEKASEPVKIFSDDKLEYAPLFIKVEKYRETLETVEALENYLKGMSRLFELVNELERIRSLNISALSKMYEKALKTASKLYGGLLKPKGMKIEGDLVSESEIEKLDTVVKDLNRELSMLREEIDKIRSLE